MTTDNYERDREAIKPNLAAKVKELKRDGITGMSLDNLRAITPTAGVMCPVPMYPILFAELARQVKSIKVYNA